SCFFFQAEDGIRDGHVTGVQTCALPIYGQGLGLGLPPQNKSDQPGHVVNMHVLNTVFEVLLPHRQNTGKPLTTSAHPGSYATAAIGSAAEEPDQVILDCGPSEDVRTQNVN